MTAMQDTIARSWRNSSQGLKISLLAAATLVVAALVWGVFVLTREEYRTLFSQLSDADAAAIVAELKRQKIPYRLADGGSAVNVPAEQVHDTRLALMSTDVPLTGGVGFEIFDKQGLGTTEQSQRVSYQRALQGELARTIAVVENVKQARVHLVLPESTLFKRDHQQPSAAVTLTMEPGHMLERQQILGMQRLVAASVSGLDPSRVVITDQRGVTLSAADTGVAAGGVMETRLELQRQVEGHLAQKIVRMLDGAVGPGQALVSVDVALRFDAIKTTTHDLLPLHGATGPNASAVVRRRQVNTGSASDGASDGFVETATLSRPSASTTEVEYEYGRRVEEVISAPGAVRRIAVGVVVPPSVDSDQQQRILELVRVAAGVDDDRGDLVTVQALGNHLVSASTGSAAVETDVETSTPPRATDPGAGSSSWTTFKGAPSLPIIALVLALMVVLAFALVRRPRSLSDREREQLLDEIRRTMGEDSRVSQLKTRQ